MNRLAAATSPYLLQHKENPVDWWEWGPDAFADARGHNLPVLLSEVGPAEAPTRVDRRKERTRNALLGAARQFLSEGRWAAAQRKISCTVTLSTPNATVPAQGVSRVT